MQNHKYDIILAVIIIFVSILTLFIINMTKRTENLIAYIYHDSEIVETIYLTALGEDVAYYTVIGDLGEVVIAAKHNSICIIESNCLNQICVAQGWANSSAQVITCVPNKIYIKLVSDTTIVDVEV